MASQATINLIQNSGLMLRPQSREKIQDLIKLKEKIEMQNKAFKKILLMKKVE